MIEGLCHNLIRKRLRDKKAIIILGPRQVGKSTLLHQLENDLAQPVLWWDGYFWRTHAQQEIDYLEEKDGKIYAYEFKWNPKSAKKFSKSFTDVYHPAEMKIISQDNFEEFIGIR